MNDIHTAVRILNEAFSADPATMAKLVDTRFACNSALANHPTIQVAGGDNEPHVGILGILNGILEPMTGERVAAKYGENGLEGFTIYQRQ